MKLLNKLVLVSFVLFLFAVCFTFYAYNRLTQDTPNENVTPGRSGVPEIIETESNISSSDASLARERQYVLKLEGDFICAYIIEESGNAILWNSTCKPLSLSPEEVKKLEGGLYASGFEELCLFFEAYAS